MYNAENSRYILELIPSISSLTQGACIQGCAHCPAATVEQESLDRLDLNGEQRDALKATIQKIVLEENPSAFQQLTLPYPIRPGMNLGSPIELPVAPKVFAVGIGRIKLGMSDDELSGLIPSLIKALPFKTMEEGMHLKPSLQVTYRMPSFPERYERETLEAFYGMAAALYHGITDEDQKTFSKKRMTLIENENYAPSTVEFTTEYVLHRLRMIRCIFEELFQKKSFSISDSMTADANQLSTANTLFLERKARFNDGSEFEAWSRVIKRGAKHGFQPLQDSKPHNITFMPDQIWVGHNTQYVGDNTLRFSYENYHQVLDATFNGKPNTISLGEALHREVQTKRSLQSGRQPHIS